ncbi:polynucleotide 5'-hydroxyl-kinase NOL9-like isoform X2 [Aquarana catesbeiana]|uniref:polynucleotide 5'-hydroxyl-kinase NOL9-like isoform X2 n=1 Tax=Aquarana catesbeiana TaxID=8400 RepID=UPI003CC9834E
MFYSTDGTSRRTDQQLYSDPSGVRQDLLCQAGFGLLLLIDLIRLLSPSHIVQMVAEGGERMEPLTPEYVKSAAGYMTKASSDTKYKNQGLDSSDEEEDSDLHFRPSLGHELLQVENSYSGAGGTETVRCHGWFLRDLAMLGYIGKLQQFEQIIPLNSFVPYEVLFGELTWRKRVYHILTPIHPSSCSAIGELPANWKHIYTPQHLQEPAWN